MKKFLALAALIAVGSAHAEDLKFGDLNYFLPAGKHNIGADILVNNENSRAGKAINVEVFSYLLDTRYAYGLSDRFNFVVGVQTLLDGETEVASGPSADAQGFQNPTLGLNWRMMEQNSAGMNLDLGAVGTFKLMDREVSTNNNAGNMIDPLISNYTDARNGLEFNARLGKKWNEANEFYILAGANYHADGEYELKQGGTDVDMDSSIDYKLGGFYQYRPVNEFMLTVGVTGTRFGETDFKNGATSFTRDEHLDFQTMFNAKYLVSESAIVKFQVTADRREDFDANVKYDNRFANQYGLGVDFLF